MKWVIEVKGTRYKFETEAAALAKAAEIFEKTGIVVGVSRED